MAEKLLEIHRHGAEHPMEHNLVDCALRFANLDKSTQLLAILEDWEFSRIVFLCYA